MKTLKSGLTTVIVIGLLASSAVGVVAQDEATEEATPAFFAWTLDPEGWEITDGNFDEPAPGVVRISGETITERIEADDPRASGLWTRVVNRDDVFLNIDTEDEQILSVVASSHRLVNDEGSWVGTGNEAGHMFQFSDEGMSGVSLAVLTGEDDYAGLALILASSGGDAGGWGLIVPESSVPPVPEMPAG